MSIKTNSQILKEVVDIFVPTFASTFLTYIIETINLAYVGHLGDPYLISGVALGTIYFYTFGLTVLMGLNSVVATLVS
jgi:Na+-driven multidrug efflux pump